jgi:hypothetical protein
VVAYTIPEGGEIFYPGANLPASTH